MSRMIYRLQIGPWNLDLSEDLYEELRFTMNEHETVGFQDGTTHFGRVTITECAAPENAKVEP